MAQKNNSDEKKKVVHNSPAGTLAFPLAVVMRPTTTTTTCYPSERISPATHALLPANNGTICTPPPWCRHPEALLFVLLEQQREILVCRLERALDHEAAAVAVHRHALGVRVGGQHGELVVRVTTGRQHGQGLIETATCGIARHGVWR